jgi:hypothetical protein
MDVILITFPMTIEEPRAQKPPCTAEAWPNDGDPVLCATGDTPKHALERLLPMILSEMDRLDPDSLTWDKLDVARERAEGILAKPEEFSLW